MSDSGRHLLPLKLLLLLGGVAASVNLDLPEGFAEQLRCPFARVWLEHGAGHAAELLGLNRRRPHGGAGRQLADIVWGSCAYQNPFTGSEACFELRGQAWTEDGAAARCRGVMPDTEGTLSRGAPCAALATGELAGWCSTERGAEMAVLGLQAGSSCREVAESCKTLSSGTFVPAAACEASAAAGLWSSSNGSVAEVGRCAIAPGPIGAAHQMAQSPGYDFNCEGAPGQQSPFMWPLRWTALVESKSLGYQSDEVLFESRGRVWYRLDRNWKRSDTWYQRGTHRIIGAWPCTSNATTAAAQEGNTEPRCNRSDTKMNRTMLHRGSKMVFIEWGEEGISNCSWLDMRMVGNIRPDWFMDDRGANTAVQYLGDSHVYHRGEPRLVRQWRKKDFASQYFTMSMQRNVGVDGVHWPLILNVPGEGFGDDFLQHYHEHRVLEAAEEDAFLLDEAFVASGGACPERVRSKKSGEGGGAPNMAHKVPSNLEVQPVAWRDIVYTGSPVWEGPVTDSDGEGGGEEAAEAVDLELAEGIRARACFQNATSSLHLTLTIEELDDRPWVAVGFRDAAEEECSMTPRGGGDGEVVFAQPDAQGVYALSFGPLPEQLRRFAADAASAFKEGLTPLAQADDFHQGRAEHSGGSLVVDFARRYTSKPAEALRFSYAVGTSKEIGYHLKRGCFSVAEPLQACSSSSSVLVQRPPRCPAGCQACDSAADAAAQDKTYMSRAGRSAALGSLLVLLVLALACR